MFDLACRQTLNRVSHDCEPSHAYCHSCKPHIEKDGYKREIVWCRAPLLDGRECGNRAFRKDVVSDFVPLDWYNMATTGFNREWRLVGTDWVHRVTGEIYGQRAGGRRVRERRKMGFFKCKRCDLFFPTDHYRRLHNMQTHSRKSFPCGSCEHSFMDARSLRKHQNNVFGCRKKKLAKGRKCVHCDTIFTRANNCTAHMKKCKKRVMLNWGD